MFDRDCNYEKLKHFLNLYEDENNILRLKSKFDSLETWNHDQKNSIFLRSHSLFTDLLTQLAHEVVTTLGFGCILVATSDNVVTTLSQSCHNVVFPTWLLRPKTNAVTLHFRRRFSDLVLTLQQRRDSDVVFLWRKSKGVPISL